MPRQTMLANSRASRRALVLTALAVMAGYCLLSSTFVAPTLRGAASRGQSAVTMLSATGEYTGFVPDMQRRTLMNLVTVAASAVPVGILLGGYLYYFVPNVGGGAGGATLCGDILGNPVKLADWVKNHKKGDRELVQGIKGEPFYLLSTEDGIKDFALSAVCTHLGCTVPWVKTSNKFICPCHGSQYNDEGKVVRGPAPLSLALAHTTSQDGNIAVTSWTETDFRTGAAPWWDA